MSNMSYCRFQNTNQDFRECADILIEMVDGDTHDVLSRDELEAAQRLAAKAVELVLRLAEDAGLDIGDLDQLESGIKETIKDLNDKTREAMETEEPEEGEETPTDEPL